ncbi:MAG: GNAT family N-acetyltransferase [Deltaproteobacteria bacterium]|jgi:RimJ/RimL family protein N-acetyltransferase|nr:GNAT family N-acetyltransferase [Deltaproteobacteria bacterium]
MTRPPTVTTRQLLLRPWQPEDLEPLFEIQGDRETMRYTWCAPDRQAAEERFLAYQARGALDGYAPWTATSREDDRGVGWGGLNQDPIDPGWGPEVGYFIRRDDWGRGLASEITAAALHLAFAEHRLPVVDAFAQPANPASIRVLERNGFRFLDWVPALRRNRYRIEREAWEARRG